MSVATTVEFEELVRRPASWQGECIAVNGYWKGRRLFDSKAAAQQTSAQSSDVARRHMIGLYGRQELLNAAPEHPEAHTAVGIAGDCKSLWQAAPVVMGYCHYRTSGPYVALAEMRRR